MSLETNNGSDQKVWTRGRIISVGASTYAIHINLKDGSFISFTIGMK